MHVLTHYTRIKNNTVFNSGNLIFSAEGVPFGEFSEQCYRHLSINYPKFHKMDNLSKLGFLGADILLENNVLTNKYDPFDIGIILSNQNSSLDTDIRHHKQIQSGPASPAVFVYSLPNIVIGEICIRHGIKGENTFFISTEYQIAEQVDYISLLLNTGVIKACIGGWVEYTSHGYDSFLYLVEEGTQKTGLPFTTGEVKKLYNS